MYMGLKDIPGVDAVVFGNTWVLRIYTDLVWIIHEYV